MFNYTLEPGRFAQLVESEEHLSDKRTLVHAVHTLFSLGNYLKLAEISDELTRKYLINDAADTIVARCDKAAVGRRKITDDKTGALNNIGFPLSPLGQRWSPLS